jgi:hypothetical protein
MRAINLLPTQAVSQPGAGLGGKLPFVASGAVPLIALILVFVGYSSGSSAVSTKQAQLAAANAQIVALAKPVVVAPVAAAPPVDTSGLVAERTARLAALQSVLGNEIPWDTTLMNVARVLPANVWLTSLTVTSPTPADAVAPTPTPVAATTTTTATDTTTTTAAPPPAPVVAPIGFTILGSTYTEADVAFLLERLQLLPNLSNVLLVSTTDSVIAGKATVQFDVTASLTPASTASTP